MSGAAYPIGDGAQRGELDAALRRALARLGPLRGLLVELPLFAALAGFGMALWGRLVDPSASAEQAQALAVVCAGCVLLRSLVLVRPGGLRTTLALAIALASLFGALLAAGLPAHLLEPANWGELRDRIQTGMGGIESADLPYAGTDPWIRLTLVLGAPALVALAGTFAFWPATKRRELGRTIALGLLLIAYGVGSTLDNPGAEAFWGLVLLLLSVGWLWIPRLERGRRARALAVTAGAGLLALPFVGILNAPPLWDYENWSWFGAQRTISFQWDHDYGPLDWPRDGTTVMTVQSSVPLYWKASVLDRFDGYGWQRAVPGDAAAAAELSARSSTPGGALTRRHPGWVADATFELRALSSSFVIGTGITQSIDGVDGALAAPDGTLTHVGPPLERGDTYSVVAYVPQPTADQMREAPVATSQNRFGGSTLLTVPSDGRTTSGSVGQPAVSMPMWGSSDPAVTAQVLDSPYADTYRLARRWTAGARTPYDAVRSIELHLRSDYSYRPTVPQHTYPLPAFLFTDKAGYCQQFAGTMGLMLRMLGIPTRVVSGFAPGSGDRTTGVFQVHDFDAHAWVEVYFRGIGWVTFDPTPSAAPAESQRFIGGDSATEFRGPAPNPIHPDATGNGVGPQPTQTTAPAPGPAGSSPWGTVALIAAAVLALAGAAFAVIAWRRRSSMVAGERVSEQVDELRRALERVGWRLGPRTTLMSIEHRATGTARAAVRRYAAALREHRYGARAAEPPGPAERRAVRRSLAGAGLRGRLRALRSIPPGGPPAS